MRRGKETRGGERRWASREDGSRDVPVIVATIGYRSTPQACIPMYNVRMKKKKRKGGRAGGGREGGQREEDRKRQGVRRDEKRERKKKERKRRKVVPPTSSKALSETFFHIHGCRGCD